MYVYGCSSALAFLGWVACVIFILVWLARTKQWGMAALVLLCGGLPLIFLLPALFRPDDMPIPDSVDPYSTQALSLRAAQDQRRNLVMLVFYGCLVSLGVGWWLARGMTIGTTAPEEPPAEAPG
jgi:hypothetical protein